MGKKNIIILLIFLLIIGSIFFGWQFFSSKNSNGLNSENCGQINDKILSFSKMFIDNVLKSEKEVDFETRLKMENAVRDLNNKEILDQWNKFINSKTEGEAQNEVKNLLEKLISNIKTN
ncbi:MAG: hypothetical protein ABIJ28_02150 [Patescibacteria group bacterium]